MNNQEEIEKIIGYTFKDKGLLTTAFTHSSMDMDNNYERLEFLGDSLLNYVVSKELFFNKRFDAGKLTNYRKGIVSREPLAEIIEDLGLEQYIILGNGLTLSGLRGKKISDIYESIAGAILLDGGFECAEAFIKRTLDKRLSDPSPFVDYKSKLNEFCAQHNKTLNYVDTEIDGKFCSEVIIDGHKSASAQASSKILAQKDAAKSAFLTIRKKKK